MQIVSAALGLPCALSGAKTNVTTLRGREGLLAGSIGSLGTGMIFSS